MRRFLQSLALLASGLFLSDIALAATLHQPPVRVSNSEIKAFLSAARFPANLPTKERESYAKNALLNLHVLDRYAAQHQLTQLKQVRIGESLARLQILSGVALSWYIHQHPVSPSAVKAAYGHLRVRAGHMLFQLSEILVNTKQEASHLYHELHIGHQDFSKLARQYSKNVMTAKRGGLLGWENPKMMAAEYRMHLAGAKPGEVLSPFHTPFGWVLLRVDAKKRFRFPTFQTIAPQIRAALERREAAKWVASLRKTAQITLSNEG